MVADAPKPHVDWEAVRARLEAGAAALDQSASARSSAMRSVFHERMLRLARRQAQVRNRERAHTWIVCRVGDDEYAAPAGELAAIVRIESLARSCCAPNGVLGVFCHAGEMLTLMDTHALLGQGDSQAACGDYVLLPSQTRSELALRIDAAVGAMELSEADLGEARRAYSSSDGLIIGRTSARVGLIDFAALLTKAAATGAATCPRT